MNNRIKNNLTGYGFILPALLLLSTFVLAPIMITFYLSLTNYNGFQPPSWAGLKNFVEVFHDKNVRKALVNTFVFVVGSVPLQVCLSLLVASLVAARYRNRFGEFVRATIFIPVLCSEALVGTIFCYLFSPEADAFFNMLLMKFGFERVNWLGNSNTALMVVIIVTVWKSLGYYRSIGVSHTREQELVVRKLPQFFPPSIYRGVAGSNPSPLM